MSTMTMNIPERPMNAAVTVRVECPSCGRPATVPPSALGKRAQCNGCQAMFTIPHPRASAAARPAVSSQPPMLVAHPAQPTAAADPFVADAMRRVVADTEPSRVRTRAIWSIIGGSAAFLLGLIVTVGSREVIWWGPMLFGGLFAARGFYRLITGRE